MKTPKVSVNDRVTYRTATQTYKAVVSEVLPGGDVMVVDDEIKTPYWVPKESIVSIDKLS